MGGTDRAEGSVQANGLCMRSIGVMRWLGQCCWKETETLCRTEGGLFLLLLFLVLGARFV